MPATPKSRHAHHKRWDLPMSECRHCEHERRKCQAKVRYGSQEAVNRAALDKNIQYGWQRMLAGYLCPYCGFHHLTRAKRGTARWKRVEKRRRRWLTEQVREARKAMAS